MEKMLINATQSEEIRVALMRDNYLYSLDLDCPSDIKKKGNIYKATVTRREPSLDAVFVEYGAKRQGFLPLKEIAHEYFYRDPASFGDEKPSVTDLVREGQELLIQVDKEERGNKGAALTSFITLAGSYLVLMPNSPHAGGISRRIEGDDRDELKETLSALTIPENMGLIIRTAGVGKNTDELQADLDMLCNQWAAIKNAYHHRLAPCLIHQEGDVIIRSIRDNLRKSVSEIIIDDHVSYVKAKQYIEQVKPEFLSCLKLYNSPIPLFSYYQIESQIETAYQREVLLSSGGALVIDRTEALVSIDVNSAKATSGTDIETTARNTNIEAAYEIARQLRLRDLGGLIVIDFIDMSSSKNQRDVENALKDALKNDRARIQIGRISRFGLLEMSRQRLGPSLGESSQEICPRCEGRGSIRSIQSHCLSIVRLIEEEALKDKTGEIHVQLPVEMATYIMNEKREYLQNIEKRHSVKVIIIANPYFQTPHYHINRLKLDNLGKHKKPSFTMIERPEATLVRDDAAAHTAEPAVKGFTADYTEKSANSPGLIQRIWQVLFGLSPVPQKENTVKKSPARAQHTPAPQEQTSGTPYRAKRRNGSQHRSQGQRKRRSSNNHPHATQGQSSSNHPNRAASPARTQDGHNKKASEIK